MWSQTDLKKQQFCILNSLNDVSSCNLKVHYNYETHIIVPTKLVSWFVEFVIRTAMI